MFKYFSSALEALDNLTRAAFLPSISATPLTPRLHLLNLHLLLHPLHRSSP